jgi:predicted RNA binding protein YcfA (HicA-like mRNA interferase family)
VKLPVVRPHEVIRVLQKVGFRQVRQKGSHVQMQRGSVLVTVPVHPRDLHPRTLRSILRRAGLSISEFVALLRN